MSTASVNVWSRYDNTWFAPSPMSREEAADVVADLIRERVDNAVAEGVDAADVEAETRAMYVIRPFDAAGE